MMIPWPASEYFVGNEFILCGAEFVIDDVQKVLPPHGGQQTVFFLLQFSFEYQFHFTGFTVGLHPETDFLFLFTVDMIDFDAEFFAFLLYYKHTPCHSFWRVLQFALLHIEHPGAGEVGDLCRDR